MTQARPVAEATASGLWPVGIVLVALIVAPAARDWRDSFPYMSSPEVDHMNLAARIAVDRSDPVDAGTS